MNLNEVIAIGANQIIRDSQFKVHPNDHANKSQSSNDTFPTAMHIAAVMLIEDQLLPSLRRLKKTLQEKSAKYKNLIKLAGPIFRMPPLTLGQEISGWARMLERNEEMILAAVNI